MKSPMSRSNIKKAQEKYAKDMVDVGFFKEYSCSVCKKKVGEIGVKGVGFKLNAQHMGDMIVEIQCPHCCSGYDLHYRSVGSSISHFSEILRGVCLGISMPNPVNSFEINPQDNNLISLMNKEIKEKSTKKTPKRNK